MSEEDYVKAERVKTPPTSEAYVTRSALPACQLRLSQNGALAPFSPRICSYKKGDQSRAAFNVTMYEKVDCVRNAPLLFFQSSSGA